MDSHQVTPGREPDDADGDESSRGGQVSSGSSSFENAETSEGGADAVPDTPDVNVDGTD